MHFLTNPLIVYPLTPPPPPLHHHHTNQPTTYSIIIPYLPFTISTTDTECHIEVITTMGLPGEYSITVPFTPSHEFAYIDNLTIVAKVRTTTLSRPQDVHLLYPTPTPIYVTLFYPSPTVPLLQPSLS